MKKGTIWNSAKEYDFKKSEIKVCGDDRVRITTEKEDIKGYVLKYELMCIDQGGKAFKQFFYERATS